jgi:hypothetical protein
MLGQLANYCPIIARKSITDQSTSLASIWQKIRLHLQFEKTGAHFLEFDNIKPKPEESPEILFQEITAFIDDNLLTVDSGLTHHGEHLTEDEELSPTVENIIVFQWLKLLHPGLPALVKQRYATELRSRTLASLKPEISTALNSLIDELRTSEEVKVFRAGVAREAGGTRKYKEHRQRRRQRNNKVCPLCKACKRDFDHFLSSCPYLPEQDKAYLTKARQIALISDEESEQTSDEETQDPQPSCSRRVNIKRSPFFKAFHKHHGLLLTLDTGAESNMIKHSVVQRIGATVTKSTQIAFQADGKTPLTILGETRITLTRNGQELFLEALVVEDMEGEILAGVPFMIVNDITVRPSQFLIKIKDHDTIHYDSDRRSTKKSVQRTHVLRAPATRTTIWPGDILELEVPTVDEDKVLALEPRIDCPTNPDVWPPPTMVECIAGKIRVVNDTDMPINLQRHQHVCQVLAATTPKMNPDETDQHTETRKPLTSKQQPKHTVSIDPDDILPPNTRKVFENITDEFKDVFDTNYTGYNGAAGPFKGVVNMGPVQPPQRKGRVPQYSKDKLNELQEKCDELEKLGVLRRPEDIGVVVEYLNPSFLVKKSNGSYRLVTAFADVAKYCKPSPSLMPDVESTLRSIACWKYLIVTDLTSAFYQIPLSKESLKYCGISTPFKGTRVYTRCAMGMPGSETALEELMCRVFGDMLAEGAIAKLADDLYIGANSLDELTAQWYAALQALQNVNIKLSPKKTVICPKSTSILGWIWNDGSIRASTHRLSTLSTCQVPETVRGLRSFVGAFKVLSRVIPNTAQILAPLEEATAGLQSQDKIQWNEALRGHFSHAQESLINNKSIVLPQPSDQLWIVTDGSVRERGIGATLYINRNGKRHLAGFYSAKLRKNQVRWLPCEVEALGIAASIKHFSPLIIQSVHQTCLLTDSKPCVQAVEKLCRGEFSTSPRVSSFLTIVSRYQVSIRHISGATNILADFASRNAPDCREPQCQVCGFITRLEEAVVCKTSVPDILAGNMRIPYASRASWFQAQHECPDLRRVEAHLRQGTRPSKKENNIADIKRYLQFATIGRDGVLVKRSNEPFTSNQECIIIPRSMLDGLLTALHIKLDHPSKNQLRILFSRYFAALDTEKSIEHVSESCHTCVSLKKMPTFQEEQTSVTPPDAIGVSFAADVMKQNHQLILVLRETVTSFTASMLIDSEQRIPLRNGLVQLSNIIRAVDGPTATIRVDPAPGFLPLQNDELLKKHNITLEIGNPKNTNKNPVAERAVQELREELVRQESYTTMVNPLSLSLATARLNSRIRSRGLSSREMLTQRDQFTNAQLPVNDQNLIADQHRQRLSNHPSSEQSKAPHAPRSPVPNIEVGDLVYLYKDRDKLKARDRYIVVAVDEKSCSIRKFAGSQLRSKSYKVRLNDCYHVPKYPSARNEDPTPQHQESRDADEENNMDRRHSVTTQPTDEQRITPDNSNDGKDNSPLLHQEPETEAHARRRSTRKKKSPTYLNEVVWH